ncbi:hypothetical protein L0F63_001291 [Massospora cicadina]|nr:hypothetical protein L0F63_001291 [Massospora cicadina]
MSHNFISPTFNPGPRPAFPLTKPANRDVLCVLVIEATESMAPHFKTMYQSFLSPFLAQLRLPVPIEFDNLKTKLTPSLKVGVVLQDNLAAIKFEKGGPCYSAVGEGLCAALEMFDRYKENTTALNLMEPIRHCILMGNSLPHATSTSLNLREEYDNLSIDALCKKLKEYRVNCSIMSTNKILTELHRIPESINSEDCCVLDYCRAGMLGYVARMAGVLPNEAFKGPGWLRMTSIKDKRKIRDFDPAILAEIKRARLDASQTSPAASSEARPSVCPIPASGDGDSAKKPTLPLAHGVKGEEPDLSGGTNVPASATVQASPGFLQAGPQEVPSPNKRRYNKAHEAHNSTDSPNPLEGIAMQRQTSNRSGKGTAKRQAGPKKPTKAQLKAQAKANASSSFNSPGSATSLQNAGLVANSGQASHYNQPSTEPNPHTISEQSTPLQATNELPPEHQNGPVQSPMSIKSPTTPASAYPSNSEAAWAPSSQNGMLANYFKNSNFSTPNGMFQSPGVRVEAPKGAPTVAPTVAPMVASAAPGSELQLWSGEITFKLTNVNINEDAIGGVVVQAVPQNGVTAADYMLDRWPRRLQISSFLPCNIAGLLDYARNARTPAFILHPAPNGDSSKNCKVYSAILAKLPEKQGVLVVDFNLGENYSAGGSPHGLYLFKVQQRILGLAFVKACFPKLEEFSVPPEARNPGLMRPQLTPQQLAAFKQQQSISGAMMNQGMLMSMNAPMGQMNPMGMFSMNMVPPNMYMPNPAMINPHLSNLYNLEALRRVQASAPQFLNSASGLQQLQQMQAQGMQLHPQQFQQLQQLQQMHQMQLNHQQNPMNPPHLVKNPARCQPSGLECAGFFGPRDLQKYALYPLLCIYPR